MLVTKLERGLYEVIDLQYNNYRVEDSSRLNPKFERPPEYPATSHKWGIWEQAHGEWTLLDGNPSMHACLKVIATWCAASQLGVEKDK